MHMQLREEIAQECHLHCTIYGLKQSLSARFVQFNQFILFQGLIHCEMDPTIFLTSISTRCIILVVNVHDILLMKSNIARVKAYLH